MLPIDLNKGLKIRSRKTMNVQNLTLHYLKIVPIETLNNPALHLNTRTIFHLHTKASIGALTMMSLRSRETSIGDWKDRTKIISITLEEAYRVVQFIEITIALLPNMILFPHAMAKSSIKRTSTTKTRTNPHPESIKEKQKGTAIYENHHLPSPEICPNTIDNHLQLTPEIQLTTKGSHLHRICWVIHHTEAIRIAWVTVEPTFKTTINIGADYSQDFIFLDIFISFKNQRIFL